jgi:hypothetical protein
MSSPSLSANRFATAPSHSRAVFELLNQTARIVVIVVKSLLARFRKSGYPKVCR